MSDQKDGKVEDSSVDPADGDRAITILSLEYQTLRSEITTHISGRYQFLALTTTAAAILASVSSGVKQSIFPGGQWFWIGIAALVFIYGIVVYRSIGCRIIYLAEQVSKLEDEINTYASKRLLSWESVHCNARDHNWWQRIKDIIGISPPSRYAAETQVSDAADGP